VSNQKHIRTVGKDGFILTLDDNSQWSVGLGSNVRVAHWHERQRIVIKQHISGTYTLQNLDSSSKEEVKATRRR
jgi:hypothetical protein